MSNYTEQNLDGVFDALLNSKGLQALSDAASEAMHNPFWIVDMNSKFIANLSGDTKDEHLLLETTQGYADASTIELTEKNHVRRIAANLDSPYIFQAFGTDHQILTCPVKIDTTIVAYISVIDEHRPFEDKDIERMLTIAKIFAAELEKNVFYRDNKEMMFSYFLTDLLNNHISYEDIPKRLAILGYHSKKYGYLLNVDLSKIESRHIILSSLSSQLSIICKNSIGCFYQNHYVYYFTTSEILTEDDYMIQQLRKFLRDSHLKAAISAPLHSINLVARNYQKTLHALQLGHRILPEEVLYTYSTLVVDHAITFLKMNMNYSDFSNGAIDILKDYDATHHTELIPTLQEYLFCVCKINDAAENLHIHPNTVRQRISKIKELTGLSLDNGHQIFELTMALYLYFMEL